MKHLLFTMFWLLIGTQGFAKDKQHADVINYNIAPALLTQIDNYSQQWQQGLINSDVSALTSIYRKDSILMPEYQPTLNGMEKIRDYYQQLSQQRQVQKFVSTTDEIFSIGNHIFDFRTFETQISWHQSKHEKPQKLQGKYWRIWLLDENKELKVLGETFGFFSHIENSHYWVTDIQTRKDKAPSGFHPPNASVELKAYHALGRIGVLQKNGKLRSQLYTEDGVFYPYADKPKRGIDVLEPYLIGYSTNDAYVDWLQTHTHEVIYLNQYILEFTKFAVGWYYQGMPDQAFGKGMRLLKRMPDGQLRIFRHIGTHNL